MFAAKYSREKRINTLFCVCHLLIGFRLYLRVHLSFCRYQSEYGLDQNDSISYVAKNGDFIIAVNHHNKDDNLFCVEYSFILQSIPQQKETFSQCRKTINKSAYIAQAWHISFTGEV